MAQLCLFGPQTIYAGNEAEFSAPFWTLVRPLVVAGVTIVLALAAVGLGMTARIQGNLLVADYGMLDGTEIDWTIESWRNPYEMALWILAPLFSIAAARHVAPIAPFASAALLTLQTIVLAASALDNDARARVQVPASQPERHSQTSAGSRCQLAGCKRVSRNEPVGSRSRSSSR